MTYAISDMSSYDDTGKVQKSAYIMEAGDYKIYVAILSKMPENMAYVIPIK